MCIRDRICWAPYDSSTVDEVPAQGPTGDENFQWARNVWDNSNGTGSFKYGRKSETVDGTGDFKDFALTKKITPLYVGFLSLTVPPQYETSATLPNAIFNEKYHDYRPSGTTSDGKKIGCDAVKKDSLKLYYQGEVKGTGVDNNTLPQGKRVYMDLLNSTVSQRVIPVQGQNGNGRNSYHVNFMADTSMTVQLKLWTRPQTMIRISGFSGNSPYEAFQRKAVVRIRAKFQTTKGIVARVVDVPVMQVRRIVNPKGVWRRWDNNDAFRVVLTQRYGPASKELKALPSEGAWKAYIEKSTEDFMYLSGSKMVGDTVFGDTDTPIDFKINFSGTTNESESNCAIVHVEYHGFTCKHTILVRQGYNQPLELVEGKGKWSSFSVFAGKHDRDEKWNNYTAESGTAKILLTKSPLALGTFFKRANIDNGIRIKNNSTYKRFEAITGDLDIAVYKNTTDYDSTYAKWISMPGLKYNDGGSGINTTYSWPLMEATINEVAHTYSVATFEQYKALMDNCQTGFGIFYGDGATSTAFNTDTANGYSDDYNLGTENECGMRGAIVFNPNTAHQLFFPLGAQGMGRRTLQGTTESTRGVLRYSSVANVLSTSTPANQYRPISYNMPNAPGAVYWMRKGEPVAGGDDYLGWDINYNDLNFAPYDYGCANGSIGDSDACPLRLIVIE